MRVGYLLVIIRPNRAERFGSKILRCKITSSIHLGSALGRDGPEFASACPFSRNCALSYRLEEAVPFPQILDAPHGADLRGYLRVIALDFVVAEKDGALAIGDQLSLEVCADVPRAPAEDVHPGRRCCSHLS